MMRCTCMDSELCWVLVVSHCAFHMHLSPPMHCITHWIHYCYSYSTYYQNRASSLVFIFESIHHFILRAQWVWQEKQSKLNEVLVNLGVNSNKQKCSHSRCCTGHSPMEEFWLSASLLSSWHRTRAENSSPQSMHIIPIKYHLHLPD